MAGPSSPFNPASPLALPTLRLLLLVLALGGAVFLLVAAVVLYAALRFRRRAPGGDARAGRDRRGIEIVWVAGAALLLLLIFVPTVRTMRAIDPPPGGRSPDLVVVGHQWWWEIRYPRAGAVTANEIHVPTGRLLLLRVESADVIHDFWVPQLTRKIDATPGHPDEVWIEAGAAGTYLGACVEFCGVEHAWMRIRVVAESPPVFAAWQAGQRARPPAPATPEARAGKQLYDRLACGSCHAAALAVGPELEHLASRQTLGAGVSPNTPERLEAWLADPQAVKPGVLMPNFHLTPDQIRQLIAYLETRR